jgi:hypothetical protein
MHVIVKLSTLRNGEEESSSTSNMQREKEKLSVCSPNCRFHALEYRSSFLTADEVDSVETKKQINKHHADSLEASSDLQGITERVGRISPLKYILLLSLIVYNCCERE